MKKRLLLLVPVAALAIVAAVLLTSTKTEATGNPCCSGCPSCSTDLHNINCCDLYTGITSPVGTTEMVNCDNSCYTECDSSCEGACCIAIWEHETGANPRRGIIWGG